MKKNNFYKRAGLAFLFAIGFGYQTYAQNVSSIDDAIKDTLIKVTDRNPFKVTNQKSVEKTVWVFMKTSSELDTIIASEATTGKFGLGFVHILQNGVWKYNTFYGCGYPKACYTDDLLVVNGLTYSVSSKYSDASATWIVPGAWVRNPTISSLVIESMTVEKTFLEVYATSNGMEYTQRMDVNGIIYDSSATGSLQSPIVSNATYQWYRNGNLITNAKGASYTPTETGTYTVIITWTDVNVRFANARTEEDVVRTATFTFNVTKIANPTGIEDETSSSNLISLFPNPTTDHFYINTVGDFTYRIENANSNNVLSGNGNNLTQINVNGLNTGLYFVYVNSSNKQTIQKLIIK
jgi:hypothetical protein